MSPTARPLAEFELHSPMVADRASIGVSVIVPVTERPQPLEWVYREFSRVFKERGIVYEFMFVIPPWGVDMARTLRPLVEAGEPIRVFSVGRAVGESAMLQAARKHARGDILLSLPAYPRVEPEGLLELLAAVESGADLVSARRTSDRSSWVNRLQNRVFHALLRLAIGGSFQDIASGVRAMRREVLDEVPLYGDFFRFLPALVQQEGFQVDEVAVAQHQQDTGTRVYSPGVYLRRLIDLLAVFFVIRFTRKPLRFFGLMGAAVSVVGAVILLALLVQRIGGQGIADRPLLLLGVLMFVLGAQAIAIGLVGEIIVHLSASRGRSEYRVRKEAPEPRV